MLAATCGEAGVNILGLQIFPGVESVTDELVLSTPDDWTAADLADLVGRSGGLSVSAGPCTEAALTDQPTRYVQAARTILAQPASFPEVVARLFDAEADPASGRLGDLGRHGHDRRRRPGAGAPYGAVHRHRARPRRGDRRPGHRRPRAHPRERAGAELGRRVGGGATPEYVVDGDSVSAMIDGQAVGLAVVRPAAEEPDVRPVTLRVDPAWQRRGIGTRLLVDAARLANALGADEILLTTRSDNQAVLPMVMAAGLRGRIRMAADTLTVRVPVRDLKPLRL